MYPSEVDLFLPVRTFFAKFACFSAFGPNFPDAASCIFLAGIFLPGAVFVDVWRPPFSNVIGFWPFLLGWIVSLVILFFLRLAHVSDRGPALLARKSPCRSLTAEPDSGLIRIHCLVVRSAKGFLRKRDIFNGYNFWCLGLFVHLISCRPVPRFLRRTCRLGLLRLALFALDHAESV